VVQSQSQESEELLKELKAQLKSKMVVLGPPDPRRILHLLHNCGVDEYLDEEELEKKWRRCCGDPAVRPGEK
jgi:hypothetical protein